MSWENGHSLILDRTAEVSHVVGSSQHRSPRGSWTQYWLEFSGRQWPDKCQIHMCGNDAEVGAHVWVKGLRQVFILPTCQECNKDPEQEWGRGWVFVKINALAVWVERHHGTYGE